MKFIILGLSLFVGCFTLHAQPMEPHPAWASQEGQNSCSTRDAQVYRNTRQCPCGCNCRAPCRCGCLNGKPCNCPR